MNTADETLDETVICIPFSEEDGSTRPNELPSLQDAGIDFPESHELRFKAYKEVWGKCLERIQSIGQQLLEPYIESVVRKVKDEDTLPGLPHPELPVISISNPIFGASFLSSVCDELDTPSTHLYPSDASNITHAMRSIVTGLVNAKYKASSLDNYDILYLVAWYKHFISTRYDMPTLVVVLHNFEEFDPLVMQDVFYICSQQLTDLPLSFILSLNTPLPSYLHLVYPQATLAHLRVREVAIPSGLVVANEILSKTFFSPDFDPKLIIGPECLSFIADFFMRHNRSLDSLITNIQLVFMKHFSIEPLTCLMLSTPSKPSPGLLEAAFTRIAAVDNSILSAPPSELGERVVDVVDAAREKAMIRYHQAKTAFGLVDLMQKFFVEEGWKGITTWDTEKDICGVFNKFLKGDIERILSQLKQYLRLLKPQLLGRLLVPMQEFLATIVDTGDLEAMKERILAGDPQDEGFSTTVAKDFANVMDIMLRRFVGGLGDQPLAEIWYTGDMPFPSELVNPSIRASLLSGLLRPLEFTSAFEAAAATTLADVEITEDSLWKLPDTSILFRRYLDSGRMINVYDWFEAFQVVLETQREKQKEGQRGRKGKGTAVSPTKKQTRSPKKRIKNEEGGEGNAEEEEEKWKLEVQARFIRALHELDYLGFVKHTKRRADHVLRTVFEAVE